MLFLERWVSLLTTPSSVQRTNNAANIPIPHKIDIADLKHKHYIIHLSTMMKFTALVLLCTMFLSSVQGLTFVTGIMRPMVNPVAAIRQRQFASVTAAKSKPTFVADSSAPAFGNDKDDRAHRYEMLDLVYQRSLDRMDSFSQ